MAGELLVVECATQMIHIAARQAARMRTCCDRTGRLV